MIQINLLPQDQAKGTATVKTASAGGGGVAVALVLLFAFVVVIAAGGFAFFLQAQSVAKREAKQAALTRVQNEIKDKEKAAAEVKATRDALRNQIRVLETLNPSDRLYWAKKLNILPLLMPDGVYLTQLRMTEDIKEVETRESQRRQQEWQRKPARTRGARPAREMLPIITQTLVFEGIAYVPDGTSDQRLDKIIEFISALQSAEVPVPFTNEPTNFMEGFVPRINWDEFGDTRAAGRVVQQFQMSLTSRPMGRPQE